MAATTLLLAGLAVSTFAPDFFLLEGGAEGFLPARDFFSIGIAVSPDDFRFTVALQVLNVSAQITTNQTGGNSNEPLPPFQMQIDPRQVILLSVVSLAVESLAVASFATASFLAAVDFAGSSGLLSGFLLLR